MTTTTWKKFAVTLAGLMVLCHTVVASEAIVERKKEIRAEFKRVKANEKLCLDAQYSTVKFNYWDKNEILLKATVTVRAETKKWAEWLMDRIQLEHFEKTDAYHIKMKSTGVVVGKGQSIDCLWEIFLPKNKLNVDMTCRYCKNIDVGDYARSVRLQSEYSDVQVGDVSSGTVDVKTKFGSLSVGTVNKLNVNAEFSEVHANRVGQLQVQAKHCKKIEVKEVEEADIMHMEHSTLNVNWVGKGLKADRANFSKLAIGVRSNKVGFITVNGGYSSVALLVPKSVSFSYNLSTAFGRIVFSPDMEKVCRHTQVNQDYTKRHVSGTCGKESRAQHTVLTVSTKFSDILIN